jgi:asparaginyl-tRNA synthetase
MTEFKTVRELYEIILEGSRLEIEALEEVELDGWVRTNRDNGSLGFIELNDGTYFKNAQLVYTISIANYSDISKVRTGSSIHIIGKVVLTPDNKQPFELQLTSFSLVGDCDTDYPLQKKRHGNEFLREISHLRPRTNTFSAVFRVRSVLSMALHEFFQSQGFIYLHAPIITSNDAEGAGECFTVTTTNDLDYSKDFFGKHANLTVTGQLQAEAFALAFRDVYTFGPTFRAEKSNTTRHAAEFWMIEPEIAFADLDDDMDLIEDMIKFAINYVLENCPEEMKFFDQWVSKGIIEKLTKIISQNFAKLDYSAGIEILKQAVEKGHKFDNPNIKWGMDLQSEHERYLCENYANGPLFLINYPKEIKAFYMRLNDDQKTVAACDLLVPYVGELVGGSQREERFDLLQKRMQELKIENLDWYLDLRRYGGCKHAGFGLGFERLLMYITGIENIRDVLPFPRTPNNLLF